MTATLRRPISCLAASLGLLGCMPEAAPQPTKEVEFRDDVAALRAEACDPGRQIVWYDDVGEVCPPVTDWAQEKLFENGPGKLANYCVYKYNGDGTPTPSVFDGTLHDPDCFVVFPQTQDAMSDAAAEPLQAALHAAINRPSEVDLDLANTEGGRTTTAVAVIDTIPYPAPTTPNSDHGVSMAAFVRDIACPKYGSSCAVEIRTRLGMPRIEDRVLDTEDGGFNGSQFDLARAIYHTVIDAPPNTNLIINLSLGWEPQYFGTKIDNLQPVEAVYDAIQFARCKGAVVIAAAGNQGHLCTEGPLVPAKWETEPAPTIARCDELGVTLTDPIGEGSYAPLVYAAGGLGYDSEPMSGIRAGGMPRLAATAMHAVADIGSPRTPLSGTSVPAALVSGTAALSWSFFPDLSADELMRTIYAGSVPIGMLAEFIGPNAQATGVRRLDVCGAIDQARNRPDTPYPPFPLYCLGGQTVDLEPVFMALDGLDYEAPAAEDTPIFTEETTTCNVGCAEATAYLTDKTVSPCPPAISPALPFTEPQPGKPPCPACTYDVATAIVHATLDPEYEFMPVDDVQVVFNAYSESPDAYPVGPMIIPTQPPGLEISIADAPRPEAIESAHIYITFGGSAGPEVYESRLLLE